MFGARRRESMSFICTRLLLCAYYYTTCLGVICFRLKTARCGVRLAVRSYSWLKWLSVLIRIPISYFYIKYRFERFEWNFSHIEILVCIRVLVCVIWTVIIIVMQLLFEQQVLRVVNSFLKLFRRVSALPSVQNVIFGEKREVALLIIKLLSLLYELYFILLGIINATDFRTIGYLICEVYTSLSTFTMFHICFLAYFCLGSFYDRANSYVRNELRQQLKDLEQYQEGRPRHKQLRAAGKRLDECISIYDEIQRVTMNFQKLFELVLGLVLLVGFLNMAMLSYLVLTNRSYIIQFRVSLIKVSADVFVLILAIHGAQSSSKVIRRLSLENYYICEQTDWHIRLDMFLIRLNFYEFRVRPLGLFEVSNGLILVFISGMVTYLTYVLQYSMHSQRI